MRQRLSATEPDKEIEILALYDCRMGAAGSLRQLGLRAPEGARIAGQLGQTVQQLDIGSVCEQGRYQGIFPRASDIDPLRRSTVLLFRED